MSGTGTAHRHGAPGGRPCEREVELDGRRLKLTSLDRVLWPETGFTKGRLIEYYRGVAAVLLPHLAGRALTLGRFPDGVGAPGFAQTECRGRPEWVATEALTLRSGQVRNYCMAGDLPSLVWIANLGTVELHPFLWRSGRPAKPTAMVFDLDPGARRDTLDCCEVALILREALDAAGLLAVAKTSGSAGLHVFVPLDSSADFARSRAFAHQLASRLAAAHPALVTDRTGGQDRARRVLVDWAQNAERRSTVAAYSLRATDRPRVSTPLTWEEVEHAAGAGDASGLELGPEEVLDRVERLGDPFRPALAAGQRLPG